MRYAWSRGFGSLRFSSAGGFWSTGCLAALLLVACDTGEIKFDAGGRDAGPPGVDAGPEVGDCFDGRRNGDETDRDCGGSCPACARNRMCVEGTDCMTGACVAGVCGDPTCNDGVQNQDESDVDCGGSCDLCPESSHCREDSDCSSMSCRGGLCAEPNCTDGAMNGNETDVDCGGPTCDGCATGGMCTRRDDCLDQVCMDHACAPPACDDNILNGDESDRDCGGSVCRGCRDRQMCNLDADCGSLDCTGGMCVGSGEFEDDFETGTLRGEWINVSAIPWTIESTTPIAGTYSARSGAISHSQTTDLDLRVDCGAGGMVTFQYRTGTESCCDHLYFYVDSTQSGSYQGVSGPASVSFPLSAGMHTLRWRYSKDISGSPAPDAVYIDSVVTANCAAL